MARSVIKPTKPSKLDANDPRLVAVVAAATGHAEDAFRHNGWRRAPAQCSVHMDAIKGAPHADVLALSEAWNRAYRHRSNALADDALGTAQ